MSRRDSVGMMAGAHDVLSATIVEKCGWDGVWASSLEIAASRGLPDDDQLIMTDVLSVTRAMASAVSLPVLADAGTGWGDDGDVAQVVRAFEASGAAGICIADSTYPKRNSLLVGPHALTPRPDFAKRVSRACDARSNTNFLIVARVEALIAGHGAGEALGRVAAYEESGADAVVIHAKARCSKEVMRVADAWTGAVPLVLIPTTYPELSRQHLSLTGNVRLLIYANHGLRAAMTATERVFRQIRTTGEASGAESWIAPIDDLLALQSNWSR
jgi:phosphoenolpyruvate phosphomutase